MCFHEITYHCEYFTNCTWHIETRRQFSASRRPNFHSCEYREVISGGTMDDWKIAKKKTFASRFILFTVIYLFRSGERASFQRRSAANSYLALCFDGSLHSRHRCNYVSRAELINCDNIPYQHGNLLRFTRLAADHVYMAISTTSSSSFFLFFLHLLTSTVIELHSIANVMCFEHFWTFIENVFHWIEFFMICDIRDLKNILFFCAIIPLPL